MRAGRHSSIVSIEWSIRKASSAKARLPGSIAMSSRNPREPFVGSRELRTACVAIEHVHAPCSDGCAPSLRLRLRAPNLPPSPCSFGRLGTGCTGCCWKHARVCHVGAVRSESKLEVGG